MALIGEAFGVKPWDIYLYLSLKAFEVLWQYP